MANLDLPRQAATCAATLPFAELTYPFGPDWDVWKIHGKVFMLQSVLRNEEIVTLKAAPDDAIALCRMHPEITPGYHMNKRHWVTLRGGTGLTGPLVDELVADSYRLVVAKLPPSHRAR